MSALPNLATIAASNWRALFPPAHLRRGQALCACDAVTELDWDADMEAVYALVRESGRSAREVELYLERDRNKWALSSTDCSCDTPFACQHAAAVMFALLKAGFEPHPDPTGRRALPEELRSWLGAIESAAQPPPPARPEPSNRILYVLQPGSDVADGSATPSVHCVQSRRLKDGRNGSPQRYNLGTCLRGSTAAVLREADAQIALRYAAQNPDASRYSMDQIFLGHKGSGDLLREIIATGRCHWSSVEGSPLRLGDTRSAKPAWRQDGTGHLRPTLEFVPPASHVLSSAPPWYVDVEAGECGPLDAGFPPQVARTWLAGPSLDPFKSAQHFPVLAKAFEKLTLPAPAEVPVRQAKGVQPVPELHLATHRLQWWDSPWSFRQAGSQGIPILAARLSFHYGDRKIEAGDPASEMRAFDGAELVVIPRQSAAENAHVATLMAFGIEQTGQVYSSLGGTKFGTTWTLKERGDAALIEFTSTTLSELRAKGWRIERDPSFALEIVEPSEWYFETAADPVREAEDWFGVELGVRLGDEKINLLPVLIEGLRQGLEAFSPQKLQKRRAKETVLVQLPDGRRIPFPAGRLREILATLIELHSPNALHGNGHLRVHRLRAAQLAQIADAPGWSWAGPDALRNLVDRLRKLDRLPDAPVPSGLRAELRPYQVDGLRWLQFIREFGIGGVLADDMGLGKTVQALAHLVVEKEQGRLDRPCLVVSPTSVLVNWRDEAARFAPELRVLTLHGSDRHARFGEMQEADIVLTTYPLLHRDAAELLKMEFHCVLLDEAQNVKNPRTQAAQVVVQLKARHRLCLSGTPLENHLGELWSLFNFLIPGFLGDETRFRAVFRQPIEKANDEARRKLLSGRVRPFLLRRRKDEVARELPPKTEIVRKVELVGGQRDLYETIRLAMESRVRDEIERKGVNRSQIVILDALLKLRQVCCDPRLVPLQAARQVTETAKLDLLMELLPTLLEDGRRILLFSQFTSMLALIEERLTKAGIPWLLLTGETTDRATPVRRFQAGEVPLFLISLKAGGTGLNLTAADTVILYDPWWNPAVEAQATDRAHRIGQDKPVFVYRLLTTGTVEEKMEALQKRKRELVQALLEEGTGGPLQLQKDDLDLLFAPLG